MNRSLCVAALVALASAVGSAPVRADALPTDIVSAPSLTSDQKRRVQDFAATAAAQLKAADWSQQEKARDEVLAALDAQGVSVSFRLELSSALAGELGAIASGKDDHASFNAVRIAGKLGTAPGVDVVRGALGDARPAVRIGAARAARELMKAIARASVSPIQASKLEDLLDQIAKVLKSEKQATVAKNLVLALDAPRAFPQGGPLGGLLAGSLEKMSEALAARIASIRATGAQADAAEWTDALVAGVDALRRTFIDPNRAGEAKQPGLRAQAATLCGQALSLVKARAGSEKGLAGAADGAGLKTTTIASEVVLLLIEGASRSQQLDSAFAKAVDGGDAGELRKGVDDWIGAGGRLSKPPFGLDAKQFN